MNLRIFLLSTPLTLALLLSCSPPGSGPEAADPTAEAPDTAAPSGDPVEATEAIADRYVERYFERFPGEATVEGFPGADLSRLPDLSPAATAEWRDLEDALLADLERIDRSRLDGAPAALTYDFLRELLEASVGTRVCRFDLWKVSPTWTGWQSRFAYLATVQPVETEEEREAALARARALAEYLDREIANLRRGIEAGLSAPANNVERVIEQMRSLLESPVRESPFFDPGRRAEDSAFEQELEVVVAETVDPAIRRYLEFLRDEYLPAARREIAVAANPEGDLCYRSAIRYHTSLEISPEEIHRIGLEQMEKITTEMREIGRDSFGSGDLQEILETVTTEPEYTFSSRQAMVDYAEAAVKRAEEAVPDWFGLVPEATVVVVPYPAFRERSAPGAEYQSATEDRPGTYYINTYQPQTQSRAGVEATAFHETYPGHHLQISVARENDQIHPIQRYFGTSGFIEGWALYSERVADEMELYSGDVDRLGLLSNDALRAARLVVDSGMHALGWSRERALEYLSSHTAESPELAAAEIDRYIAVPGQATSYMLGNLEIRRLRQMAEEELGEDFRIQAFHDRVLEDGAVTLAMLRDKIRRWVESET